MRKPTRLEMGLAAGIAGAGIAGEKVGHHHGLKEGVQHTEDKSYRESSKGKDAIAKEYPKLRDLGDKLAAFETMTSLRASLPDEVWSERVNEFNKMVANDLLPTVDKLIASADAWKQTPAGAIIKGELQRALGIAISNSWLMEETPEVPRPNFTVLGLKEDEQKVNSIETFDDRDLIPDE